MGIPEIGHYKFPINGVLTPPQYGCAIRLSLLPLCVRPALLLNRGRPTSTSRACGRKWLKPHPVSKKTRVAMSNSAKCRLCEVDSAYPEAMLTWDTELPNFSATRYLS